MAKLSDIEGLGGKNADKLKAAGITTLEKLLDTCCTKKGRKKIADQTGINEKTVLIWVNKADLSRIKGISTQYGDLLKFAGVDTVAELAQRNPENLHAKMVQENEGGVLVKKLPSVKQVGDWVAQAKDLPRKVTY